MLALAIAHLCHHYQFDFVMSASDCSKQDKRIFCIHCEIWGIGQNTGHLRDRIASVGTNVLLLLKAISFTKMFVVAYHLMHFDVEYCKTSSYLI